MSDLRARAEEHVGLDGTVYTGEAAEKVRAMEQAVGRETAVASLDESGVPASLDVPVHIAWGRVMQDVEWIKKGRQTTSGAKYSYRGIDDVMNYVGPALRKHGVAVIPAGIDPTFEVIKTTSGSAMNYCRATVRFTIYGPKGDTMPAEVLGEGFDSGDKSGSKAQSIALRTLYTNGLAIMTNEPARDTEYGQQHEIAGPPARTPADYASEILDEQTSVARLQMIKAELDGNPRLAHTMVSDGFEEGSQIELGRLVRRVGAKRVAEGGN
jgi:hypothetical protein